MKTNLNRTSSTDTAVGIIFYLADGTIQSCNPDAEKILGYTVEQLVETSSFNLPWQTIHEDGSLFLPETYPITVSIRTGKSCSDVIVGFYKPNGDLIWLSVDTLPLFKAGNAEAYGVETTFKDITEDLKVQFTPKLSPVISSLQTPSNRPLTDDQPTQLTLQESEKRLKLATNASGIGMWFWDLLEDTLEWTDLGKAIFGIPVDDNFSYETFFNLLHPEDRDRTQEAIDRALAEQTEYSIEYRIILSDGSIRWILAKGRGFYLRECKPVSMMGTVQDISDRKKTAEILQQRERELKLITEVIPQQVWTALPNGKIDYVNQRWLEYAGATLAEIKGRNWQRVVHPEDLERVNLAWNQSITTGENYNIKARLRRADGEYCWFLGRARPLYNEQGKIAKWYGTNTSITRIKELESQLIQQTEDLANANRLKDEFLAIVSHELRTPLNSILGWAQMLSTGRLDPEKTAMGIEIIGRNAKLQAQLVEDLLDVSSILRGKLNLNKISLNLESIIKSALTTVNLAAQAKSIQIETRYEPNIGKVFGDPGRLQQVIWNLVANAIKFTLEGGQISIKLERVGSQATIQVEDNGQGINAEFLPYVFDRFSQEQSTSTRQYGGLGLGLAIVRHLTELHDGTVAVSSPGLGQGAIFIVRLPLMNVPEVERVEVETNSINQSVRPNRFSGIKILVVDDETDSLDILSFVLEQEGAAIIPATSAADALEVFNRETPDLIISDIGMPNVSGYSLITQIRQLPQGKNISAISLTAYAGEVDKQRSIEAGFQRHISKPIDISELINTIVELID
ncbi:PAS domain-containing protein [Waterburya agarophytonicola K14]|uniref:Circadian input-output histidine kinase CikA n=1 Tax=Waterburya agarophytonicola KI4 TaxID=2874699 RepID=A0A964FH26_9CYAN|nr:PAS domain-containing protein [Waterburya agarophytonicola]MCC0179575.1 PAS domain-containing protein [Waterburya agarophytonicola KI4]